MCIYVYKYMFTYSVALPAACEQCVQIYTSRFVTGTVSVAGERSTTGLNTGSALGASHAGRGLALTCDST